MSATPRHAKRSRLARIADKFRDAPSQPRIVHVGMAGHQQPALYQPFPAPGQQHREGLGDAWGPAQEPAAAPPAADAWASPEVMAQVLTAFRALADAGTDSSSEGNEAA